MIEIERRTDEGNHREDDNHASYHLVYNEDAIGVELATYLVDEPRQSEPPEQRPEHDAQIAHPHLHGHIGHHKGKLGEGCHEEEHDKRIGQGDEERRNAVVQERALLVAALVHVLGGIALEAIDAEHQEQETSEDLEVELVLGVVDNIHHEAHTQASEQGIHNVAACCSHTSHETIPTPFVQSALNTQDAHGPHRGGGKNTYDNSLENEIKNIYLYWKHYTHNRAQSYNFSGIFGNFLS